MVSNTLLKNNSKIAMTESIDMMPNSNIHFQASTACMCVAANTIKSMVKIELTSRMKAA
jgi:hypothetical protein